ncbi:putative diacylglycerol O-acyltransferase [Actinomadura rubteroloni]|uniref:Diacylglycerol O-acyltransferase n=1 Tax=Actinomadura rubteroloni TaxID=1926885 RepID=A0A2P4URB1_9ACTN|nr:wax ester/triacylglycerol synthase family O-acyltransferase [Actinomadura rubteroloni]POM27588.1 putative diacylglycerol O-acyltransferase [Actinomadura rubteroloni]
MSQLTSVDAVFLNAETDTTRAHIAGLGVVDPATCPGGRLTAAALAGLISRRAHLAPRPLRRRLVQVPLGLDRPYWEDDPEFDPARHISEVTLPRPGDDEQLARLVAALHERPLDRSRPLWELVLIHGLAGGRAAVYMKVHHAAIDGVMAAEALAALLDLSPDERDVPADETAPQRAPGTAEMMRDGLLRMAGHPLASALSVVRSVPLLDDVPGVGSLPGVGRVARLARGVLGRREHPAADTPAAPPTPFNRPIGARRAVAFGELPLDDVKRVGRALGGSVNDVVMALCATALRTWLDKRGELPAGPLVAGVPISLRRPDRGADEAAEGNMTSILAAPLATHVADPADRFTAVRADMDRMKRRFTESGGWVRDLSALVPAPFAGAATKLALLAAPMTGMRPLNLIVSNVPGPQFPLFLGGARVLAYYPVSLVTDLSGGLNITVFSYDGTIDVGIITCRDLVPDPSELVDHLHDALGELTELLRD